MKIKNTITGLPYGGAKGGLNSIQEVYQNRKFKELFVIIQLLFVKNANLGASVDVP